MEAVLLVLFVAVIIIAYWSGRNGAIPDDAEVRMKYSAFKRERDGRGCLPAFLVLLGVVIILLIVGST